MWNNFLPEYHLLTLSPDFKLIEVYVLVGLVSSLNCNAFYLNERAVFPSYKNSYFYRNYTWKADWQPWFTDVEMTDLICHLRCERIVDKYK